MSTHDYSPQQALDLLMRKLDEREKSLGEQIRAAIDAGKDVEEKEPVKGRPAKQRVYRKTVRFTDEEAIQVALGALRAWFIEQPLFVRSAAKNFMRAAVGAPVEPWQTFWRNKGQLQGLSMHGVGSEKMLEIELQTETRVSKADQQTVRLVPVLEGDIKQQKAHLRPARAAFLV
ncbi:MAG: hypothetical protein M1305_01395 [Candidatus Marsarchaeota archaeon]|nr:hypothetical protein [Candidatus Marsarchaeota archaeon]